MLGERLCVFLHEIREKGIPCESMGRKAVGSKAKAKIARLPMF